MPNLECVSDADLRAFLLGELSERISQQIASHLETRSVCESAARRLDALTDPVISSLRRVLVPEQSHAAQPTILSTDTQPIRAVQERNFPPRQLGQYTILEELARGGMSVVYRARQAHPAREVALKVLLGGAHATAERRVRFLAEADAIAQLQHPNIVQIYEVGRDEGVPFLALELVNGGSLAKRLAGQPQPPRQAAALVETLARAIHVAHQHGVVHRDLKPANILLAVASGERRVASKDKEGTAPSLTTGHSPLATLPKITDFGLAKQERIDLTTTGAVVGTPYYMAPEQAAGKTKDIGPAVDIYALGVILYEMLTGRPPFLGESPLDTLHQVQVHEPVPSRRLRPKVPRDLETICLKCLEKPPEKRYRTAADLADDLRRWQEERPIRARPISRAERLVKWARRRPAAALLIAGVFAALLGLVAGGYWTHRQQQATRAAALVQALSATETPAIGPILDDLADCRSWAVRLLRHKAETEPAGSRPWLHARLALLPTDPDQGPVLANYLLSAQPEEVQVIRDALLPFAAEFSDALWTVLVDPEAEGPRRLRAASALAAYAPDDPRWSNLVAVIVAQLLRENPFRVGRWSAALYPIRAVLIPPLVAVHRNTEARDTERVLATGVLIDYVEEPDVLAELILDANTEQFALLLPRLKMHKEAAAAFLERYLILMVANNAMLAAHEPDDARDKRQANAVLALAHLGRPEALWKRLKHTPDPSIRSWLVDRAAPLGLSPRLLLDRLESEPDKSLQRALLLALGSYDGKQVSAATRAALRERFRRDPDAGVHSALDWLLRQRWGDGAALEAIDRELRGQPVGQRQWYVTPEGYTFALIVNPGEFTMGSPESEDGRDPDEVQHRVRIPRSFALATKEVTWGQWRRFRSTHEHMKRHGSSDNHPIYSVLWFEAAAYCRWLSEREGVPEDQMVYPRIEDIKDPMELPADRLERTGYRLPTEAEWEYACRAGAVTSRFFGTSEALIDRYAVYRNNANGRGAWPAGTLKPNDFGLFDIMGNVAEWNHDEWLEYAPLKMGEVRIDLPKTCIVAAGKMRSQRGLTSFDIAPIVRSARRYGLGPEQRWSSIGFRVARTWR